MGMSYAASAGDTLDKWQDACYSQTKTSNGFNVDGIRYFWEMSNTEHPDGAITGSIWRYVDETHARKTASFRIEPDGTVSRAPKFLKDL